MFHLNCIILFEILLKIILQLHHFMGFWIKCGFYLGTLNITDLTSPKAITIRRDGFPDLAGIFCYQCLPPSLVVDEGKAYACTNSPDSPLGQTIECTYNYNEHGDPIPIRACYFGITGKL